MKGSLLVTLGSILMWTAGTFYCFPWKPLVAWASGADYLTGYKHFRRGHQHPINLGVHVVCLVLQVGGNFGLLAVLDAKLGFSGEWLAWSTIALWLATFCAVPAPSAVRVLTCLATLGGFALRHTIVEHWALLVPLAVAMQGPCAWYAAMAHYELRGGAALAFASACGGLVAAVYAAGLPPPGVLRAHAMECNLAFLLLCAALSQIRVANEPLVETVCGSLGWAVTVATGDPCMVLLTFSFVGSSLQGVAHEYTAEKATLGQLTNLTDEMAHVTFFPALLVNACWDALAQTRNTRSKSTRSDSPSPAHSQSKKSTPPPLGLVGATTRRKSKSPAKYDPAVSTSTTFY
jgi:hypothetical protein